jgi:Protein of unknown function (DUF4038)/IPT/TIG domain/Putative collagen-binding domain of a collagenase
MPWSETAKRVMSARFTKALIPGAFCIAFALLADREGRHSLTRASVYAIVPTVGSVSPQSGTTAGGTVVTITGANFAASATVTFGGAPATNVIVNGQTQITATSPAGSAGEVTVAVRTGEQSGSLTNGFNYVAAAAAREAVKPAPHLRLSVGPNRRYLVDQNGTPFLIMGDAPQAMVGNLNRGDMATYMADRERLGFNGLWVNLLCASYTGCSANGATFDGVAPFTSGTDPSNYDLNTPNDAYFERVDAMLNLAAEHNLVVFLDPIETGGWLVTLRKNGPAAAFSYGAFVGSRYKNVANIVWLHGNDFQTWSSAPGDSALVQQVMAGIASTDPSHIQTIELNYNTSYSSQNTAMRSLLTLNSAYTYQETYDVLLQAYNSSRTLPTYLVEANYEFENDTGALPGVAGAYVLREQAYWTLLSGGTGQLYGSAHIWPFRSGWQALLDSPGALEIQYINKLFGGVSWWELVPDQKHQVVVAGYGSYDAGNLNLTTANYCTTSWITDGSLALAYCPRSSSLMVDLAKFSGPVTAEWYDPSNGVYAAISGSPFLNSGIRQFTTPGANQDGNHDWVLKLHR